MKVSYTLGIGLAASTAAQYTYPDCVNGQLASNGVCDTDLPRAERAAALVASMNVTEKLGNLVR